MKKKLTAIAALAIALLLLAACASAGTSTESAAEATPEAAEESLNMQEMAPVEDAAAASDSDVSLEEASSDSDIQEAPASEGDAEESSDAAADTLPIEDQDLITAQGLVGHPVQDLYDAIGEPAGGAQYSKSCMDGAEENAQDGMLYYDTFSVWTYKTDDSEVIEAVYEMPAE